MKPANNSLWRRRPTTPDCVEACQQPLTWVTLAAHPLIVLIFCGDSGLLPLIVKRNTKLCYSGKKGGSDPLSPFSLLDCLEKFCVNSAAVPVRSLKLLACLFPANHSAYQGRTNVKISAKKVTPWLLQAKQNYSWTQQSKTTV